MSPTGVVDAIVTEAVSCLDWPHVVCVLDPYLDHPIAFGPFPDPVSASAFAVRYAEDLTYDGCSDGVGVIIVPLRQT